MTKAKTRMKALLRSFLSALIAAVLVTALAGGQCISCQTGASASSGKGDCCTPDGRCKTSTPTRCLKAHNADTALIQQSAQMYPVMTASSIDVIAWIDPVLSQVLAPAPLTCSYSPPEPYLLNSVFLI
jgi:hypothetical protein